MKATTKKVFITTKDFLVTEESFDLLYDDELKMLVTFPQPKIEHLEKYYQTEAYISHTDSNKGLMAFLYQKVKNRSVKSKVNLIHKLNKIDGSVLDIGAGTGEFLKTASSKGWKITGVEPNQNARSVAMAKGIRLEDSIDSLNNTKYDVVTLWHVLEHLPELESFVKKIENFVKPGGILIVAVPNYESYDAKFYKNFWAAYDVPRHLWHFSKASMTRLFSKQMILADIKPMIYDSFYVSLLSEKYKTGNKFSVRGILVGFWSNISAWRTKEYSSHIYCFKKAN